MLSRLRLRNLIQSVTRFGTVHGLVSRHQQLIQSFALNAKRRGADTNAHAGFAATADVERKL